VDLGTATSVSLHKKQSGASCGRRKNCFELFRVDIIRSVWEYIVTFTQATTSPGSFVGLWSRGDRLGKSATWQIGTAAHVYACAGGLAFRVFTIALALLWPRASAGSDQAPYLIADFEGPTALQSWRFYGVPESDVAGGPLVLGPGHRGHGAVLAYSLPCDRQAECDTYAEALWTAASPLPAKRDPAISLWMRFPQNVEVSLLAKDTSGQRLRFPIRATIEHIKVGDWQYVMVPLSLGQPRMQPKTDAPGSKGAWWKSVSSFGPEVEQVCKVR